MKICKKEAEKIIDNFCTKHAGVDAFYDGKTLSIFLADKHDPYDFEVLNLKGIGDALQYVVDTFMEF